MYPSPQWHSPPLSHVALPRSLLVCWAYWVASIDKGMQVPGISTQRQILKRGSRLLSTYSDVVNPHTSPSRSHRAPRCEWWTLLTREVGLAPKTWSGGELAQIGNQLSTALNKYLVSRIRLSKNSPSEWQSLGTSTSTSNKTSEPSLDPYYWH